MNLWYLIAIVYLVLVAGLHAWAEYRGRLWRYFGTVTGSDWLGYWCDRCGFKVFVLPAFVLQVVAILGAFWSPLRGTGDANGWFLSLLVGACIGDAIFSHFGPALKVWPNPGHGSAIVYMINALVLVGVFQDRLTAAPALLAAGFFALVIPFLFRTRWNLDD